jgi:hypothetical protein
VPGDRHYSQLLDLAAKYNLPDEALLVNAPQSDPTGGLDLDDPTVLAALADRIQRERPGLVIVDTVGMTTAMNLCRPEDARAYFEPLMEIAQQTAVPFLLLTHLSKDANALGRRIVEKARVVWKMTTPDPEEQPNRRRVWVDKTYVANPPAMGMTIADTGCSFDFNPPIAPEPNKGGRTPESREKAREFILEALRRTNDQKASQLCDAWEKAGNNKNAFWRARDEMVKDGEITCKGKPFIMHLLDTNPETSTP